MDTSPETSGAAAPATYKVAITEQHAGRILLFDRNAQWTDANVRWSFSTGNATGWDHPFCGNCATASSTCTTICCARTGTRSRPSPRRTWRPGPGRR